MDNVICYADENLPNTRLVSLLKKHNFELLVCKRENISEKLSKAKLALIFFSENPSEKKFKEILFQFDKKVSILIIFEYEGDYHLSWFPDKPNFNFLFPPFSNEDIIFSLQSFRNYNQRKSELRLFKDELQSKKRMVKVYHELTKTLTSTLKLKKLLRKIRDKNSKLLRCNAISIYLFNSEINKLEYVKINKKLQYVPYSSSLSIGERVPGIVFKTSRSIIANKPFSKKIVKEIENYYPFEINGICCVPLYYRGNTLGAVEAINKLNGEPFEESDLVILRILADHSAIAIENSRLFERVQKLTVIDDLTQLFNYRFFNIMLSNEFMRAQRFLSPLSLLFLDLDGFKRVNDVFGHMLGSEVLKEIADVIKTTVRKIDIVSRFGGDEFTVILPGTGYEGAELVARRIQKNIENYSYPIEGWNINISVSIGISSFPEHVQTNEQLLKLADKAMYKLKENRKRDLSIGTLSSPDRNKFL